MGLKAFDVTFNLYRKDHVLAMHSSCTVLAKSQRITDLFPAIYELIQKTNPQTTSDKYPNLNLLYVYEHKYSDMSAYEQGQYSARHGTDSIMGNPYVQNGVQQPEADEWHNGFTEEHRRIHGAKND